MKTIKINKFSEVPNNFTGIAEFSNGDKIWFKEGKLHREGGPACEWANGNKEWFKEGKGHRIDGPAGVYANSTKMLWLIEGKQIPTEINITNKLYLGKEKGKYNLEWLRFLTEEGIEEYPIILGKSYLFIKQSYNLEELLTCVK